MNWMTESFAPKANKIAKNPWVASVQDAVLAGMPMIFIGSFATILSVINDLWKSFPDFSLLSTFSFGLFSLFLAYLLPESIMKHKDHKDVAKQVGLAGLSFFLLMTYPVFDRAGNLVLDINLLGTGGMLTALVSGFIVGIVMNLASKYQFFDEDSSLPDFVATWFNTLIPIIILLLFGWFLVNQLHFNMSESITTLLMPLVKLGGSFWGFTLIIFLGYAFLYSFGISSWIIYPIEAAIALPGIAENARNAAQGQEATNIFVQEVTNLVVVGGGGATLSLAIMMAFMAKSTRMKIVGRAGIIPSIFNINEPIVFGAPIVFNPLLMIPMWIMGLLGPILAWVTMKIGLVPIPEHVFNLWYLPTPILGYFSTQSFRGVIFVIIIFVISWFVYFPFFKAADNQQLEKEKHPETEEE